ncbi:MAG: glycosyltransferase family 9 protein [Nitrospirae bacterium]|nr:glycosyltransferase family 9 protein [Nitrospirota bacterium]
MRRPTKSILLIRLSAMGDIVMASPVIAGFRAEYPDSRIAWLVEEGFEDLLKANPLLDEVIVLPRRTWKRMVREGRLWALGSSLIGFAKELRRRRFDLAVDLQGLLKSGIWAVLSGAAERIGLGSKEGSRRLMTSVVPKPSGDPRIGSEYRRLLSVLGFEMGPFRMDVALNEADEHFAEAFRGDNGLEGGYIVITPFTTRPQKHWVETRWNDLARDLSANLGLRTVILGGSGDREAAERIASRDRVRSSFDKLRTNGKSNTCGGELLDMTGRTTLRQAAALIKHAALLIGVDTGLTHVGIAFHIPTIAIFGSTCPYTDTTRENAVVFYKKLACSPCRRNPTCNGTFDCMKSVTVEEVSREASRLIRVPSPECH